MERKVLLVDDDELVLNALSSSLESWARSRQVGLLTAQSASRALNLLSEHGAAIAIVLSDLRMPGMKGSDLLVEVRRLYPDTITMLTTGFPEVAEISRAVSAGIYFFILKPWDLGYLESEMDKAWRFSTVQEQNRRYVSMLEDELRWGGALQRALLRIDPPAGAAAVFESSYVPLEQLHCGGDFYDLIPLSGGRYMGMIGDVAGHGIKAGFVTIVLKAMIRELFARGEPASPASLLTWLNGRVCGILPDMPELLVTFAACLLETSPPRVVYASAGHPSPHLVRGAEAQKLQVPGPGLGFDPSAGYEKQSLALRAADRLVLYTAGLTELERGAGSIPEERFRDVLVAAAGDNGHNEAVVRRMRALAPQGRFIDDVAILSAALQ